MLLEIFSVINFKLRVKEYLKKIFLKFIGVNDSCDLIPDWFMFEYWRMMLEADFSPCNIYTVILGQNFLVVQKHWNQ